MNATDLCYTPATELASLIRDKALSPVELTGAVLDRIERLDPNLNCFCTLAADPALEGARRAEQAVMKGGPLGPLHGIPFSVKDLALTQGLRSMSGSFIFEHRVPDTDAPFVRRLKEAGGIMLGKTTTPEFGWKAIGDSPLTGITRNPWNTGMTSGGSSAGAAVATAAGLGPTRARTARAPFASPHPSAASTASSPPMGACPCGPPPTPTAPRTWGP